MKLIRTCCACCSVINVCIWAAAQFCAMIMICCWLACMALHGTSARLYNMAKQSQRSRMLPSDADYLYFDALPSKFDGFVNNRARFIWNISRAHHSVPSTFWHVKHLTTDREHVWKGHKPIVADFKPSKYVTTDSFCGSEIV